MGHRRVHSEIFLRFPDEISFGGSMEEGDHEADDDLLATYMDMEKIESFGETPKNPMNYNYNNINNINNNYEKHTHCFSVNDYSGISSNNNDNDKDNDNEDSNIKNNKNGGAACCDAKKAMPPHKLAELWIVDPKRAKRILANRQSAARSKERKALYMQELEKKVRSLQTEATALSVQLSLFKRDTTGLTSENIDLRRQLESMEQQAQLRNALNDALKQELDRLKVATGDTSTPADALVMPLQNGPSHSQLQQHQHQQQQHSSFPFESNMLMSPHQTESHNSKMSSLHPFELSISHPSPALQSPRTEMLHSSHHPVDQLIEPNMFNLPQQQKVQQFCPLDRGFFVPSESSKPSIPQYCTNEANMNYPPQPMDSPLGHLPPYSFESNTQSPEQERYTTSQPKFLAQMPKQDQISKLQGFHINGFDSYNLVKVEGPSIIANENMEGF